MDTSQDRRVVYQTGIGRIPICKRCGRSERECVCRSQGSRGSATAYPQDGFVRIARDRKRRGGKTVTVIANLPDDPELLQSLAQTFKKLCASGGAVRDNVIEVQGDHRDRLEMKLQELGYRVKRVGG